MRGSLTRAYAQFVTTRERVASVTETSIPGPGGPIRLRAYRPHARGITPCLVWFHGGGFVFGDLYTAGASCRALADRTGATVIAVDHRLAPEHPLEDGRASCPRNGRRGYEV